MSYKPNEDIFFNSSTILKLQVEVDPKCPFTEMAYTEILNYQKDNYHKPKYLLLSYDHYKYLIAELYQTHVDLGVEFIVVPSQIAMLARGHHDNDFATLAATRG